ncbi:unnamed protein product (macronuclear) [Paramecium tetraurelia]|uniref:Protein kinase domain-containing protein n=1 Tax=Paramecium tetraurelia TaxID=5888 RepID=A0DHD0_PARTE|nr:uncharacterized protein GSPATT00016834001 [Paramecium tetraurelia]CAK82447.1 unnamed protein product [Paramecium tetraurelia]|eukprot:XP_001449844.1 hypothetical protein (macronuclear) [Paramecium tetraurelia strain d4-2]
MKQNLEEIAATIPNYKMVDGKYYIKTTKLGKGNFAETHLATLKDNEKIVYACKLIAKQNIIEKLKKSNNPDSRKEYIINSLKKEVSLWKQMDHPNIVKFIDFSETPNNIYFFLEYCNGGDLDMLIKDKGKLSEQEAADIFLQIAEGCSYLYDKSVFHRDLKPENILIHNGTAKLADFGFAKVIEEDKKDVAAHGTSVGTPYYMAPQILAGEDYCIKCDVWSLGVILYQMLFGVLPWKDTNSIIQLLNAINNQKIQFPNTNPVGQEMKDLITKMLQKREEDRINIKEVCEALNKIKK